MSLNRVSNRRSMRDSLPRTIRNGRECLTCCYSGSSPRNSRTNREDILTVPVQAVLAYEGKDHVAVKRPDGRFDWREVTLGASDGSMVEVKQGIEPGEQVALKPIELLSEHEKRLKKL